MSSDMAAYSAENLNVLWGAACVRARPGMYLGGIDEHGLFNLVMEAVGVCLNAVPPPASLSLELLSGDGVRVRCPGLASHPEALAKRLEDPCLPGMPIVVGALSSTLVAETSHAGMLWRMAWERGDLVAPPGIVGACDEPVTTLTFHPDPEIFRQGTTIPREMLAERFRELAALRGIRLSLASGQIAQEFHCPNGVADLLDWHLRDSVVVCAPVASSLDNADGKAMLALGWRRRGDLFLGYCNGERMRHGEHVRGVQETLRTRTRERGSVPTGWGLAVALSVELAEPHFGSPTRDNLLNLEARRLAASATLACLETLRRERSAETMQGVEAWMAGRR